MSARPGRADRRRGSCPAPRARRARRRATEEPARRRCQEWAARVGLQMALGSASGMPIDPRVQLRGPTAVRFSRPRSATSTCSLSRGRGPRTQAPTSGRLWALVCCNPLLGPPSSATRPGLTAFRQSAANSASVHHVPAQQMRRLRPGDRHPLANPGRVVGRRSVVSGQGRHRHQSTTSSSTPHSASCSEVLTPDADPMAGDSTVQNHASGG
jgi:hypothetical protein